jgi:hypothetical protein
MRFVFLFWLLSPFLIWLFYFRIRKEYKSREISVPGHNIFADERPFLFYAVLIAEALILLWAVHFFLFGIMQFLCATFDLCFYTP